VSRFLYVRSDTRLTKPMSVNTTVCLTSHNLSPTTAVETTDREEVKKAKLS